VKDPTAGPPDVVALPLEEALHALQAAGWRVRVRETAPPRSSPAGGVRRVVRQRATTGGEVELVVAWERYTLFRRGPEDGVPSSTGAGGPHP
jgi:beta-lactam-binding protein with PASTA domain